MGSHSHGYGVKLAALIIAIIVFIVCAASVVTSDEAAEPQVTPPGMTERDYWATLPVALLDDIIEGHKEQINELVDDIVYIQRLKAHRYSDESVLRDMP